MHSCIGLHNWNDVGHKKIYCGSSFASTAKDGQNVFQILQKFDHPRFAIVYLHKTFKRNCPQHTHVAFWARVQCTQMLRITCRAWGVWGGGFPLIPLVFSPTCLESTLSLLAVFRFFGAIAPTRYTASSKLSRKISESRRHLTSPRKRPKMRVRSPSSLFSMCPPALVWTGTLLVNLTIIICHPECRIATDKSWPQ